MACIFCKMPYFFFQRPMFRFFCAQCAAEISVFVARLVLANSKNARDSR